MTQTEKKHIIAVAERNIDSFVKDKQQFENRMFWLGWKQSEIDLMVKHLVSKLTPPPVG